MPEAPGGEIALTGSEAGATRKTPLPVAARPTSPQRGEVEDQPRPTPSTPAPAPPRDPPKPAYPLPLRERLRLQKLQGGVICHFHDHDDDALMEAGGKWPEDATLTREEVRVLVHGPNPRPFDSRLTGCEPPPPDV